MNSSTYDLLDKELATLIKSRKTYSPGTAEYDSISKSISELMKAIGEADRNENDNYSAVQKALHDNDEIKLRKEELKRKDDELRLNSDIEDKKIDHEVRIAEIAAATEKKKVRTSVIVAISTAAGALGTSVVSSILEQNGVLTSRPIQRLIDWLGKGPFKR